MSGNALGDGGSTRREQWLAVFGQVFYRSIVFFILAVAAVALLTVVTRPMLSVRREIPEEHELSGALPKSFPKVLIRSETLQRARSMDFAEFRACTLVNPRQVGQIESWLSAGRAEPLTSFQRHNWIENGPGWFRAAAMADESEFSTVELNAGRSVSDLMIVGLSASKSRLFLIMIRP